MTEITDAELLAAAREYGPYGSIRDDGVDIREDVHERYWSQLGRIWQILSALDARDTQADQDVNGFDAMRFLTRPSSQLALEVHEAYQAMWDHLVQGASLAGRPRWTVEQCAAHTGMVASTWRAMVSRGKAPPPLPGYDPDTGRRTWDCAVVRGWHAVRAGQGTRTDLR